MAENSLDLVKAKKNEVLIWRHFYVNEMYENSKDEEAAITPVIQVLSHSHVTNRTGSEFHLASDRKLIRTIPC